MTRFRCTGCRKEYDDKEEAEECAGSHSPVDGRGFSKAVRVYRNEGPETEPTSLFDYE